MQERSQCKKDSQTQERVDTSADVRIDAIYPDCVDPRIGGAVAHGRCADGWKRVCLEGKGVCFQRAKRICSIRQVRSSKGTSDKTESHSSKSLLRSEV